MFTKSQVLTLTFLLSACSAIPNNIAPGYKETFNTMRTLIVGYEDDLITNELVSNIPYASMSLKIGKGPTGLIILESVAGDNYNWVSADSIYLVIRNGKVIKTEGLANDLFEVINSDKKFEEIFANKKDKDIAYYSYEDPQISNIKLDLSYQVKDKEMINILGKQKELIHIEENVKSSQFGWNFNNHYWVDDNFFVWKSLQTVNPKIPQFELTVTKKPSL